MPVSNFLSKLLKLSNSSSVIFSTVFLAALSGKVTECRQDVLKSDKFPVIALIQTQEKYKGGRQLTSSPCQTVELEDVSSGLYPVWRDGKKWLADKNGVIQYGPMDD